MALWRGCSIISQKGRLASAGRSREADAQQLIFIDFGRLGARCFLQVEKTYKGAGTSGGLWNVWMVNQYIGLGYFITFDRI